MTTNAWATSLLSLPLGTVLSITMKGTGRVLVGTFAGEYTQDVMPALLLDMADGSSFPQIAVMLCTIADAHEIGGMHSSASAVTALVSPKQCIHRVSLTEDCEPCEVAYDRVKNDGYTYLVPPTRRTI